VSSFLAASDSLANEESVVVEALDAVLAARMTSDDDSTALRAVIRDVFPSGARQRNAEGCGGGEKSWIDMLTNALVDQLSASRLDASDAFIAKVWPVADTRRVCIQLQIDYLQIINECIVSVVICLYCRKLHLVLSK
jgi:hypothetical protein